MRLLYKMRGPFTSTLCSAGPVSHIRLLKINYALRLEQLQSCPTLFDSVDYSPPGSSVHGTLQTRILEWVPLPSPGDPSHPGIEPTPHVLAGEFFTTGTTWEAKATLSTS